MPLKDRLIIGSLCLVLFLFFFNLFWLPVILLAHPSPLYSLLFAVPSAVFAFFAVRSGLRSYSILLYGPPRSWGVD